MNDSLFFKNTHNDDDDNDNDNNDNNDNDNDNDDDDDNDNDNDDDDDGDDNDDDDDDDNNEEDYASKGIDFQGYFMRYNLDSFCEIGFGVNINSLNANEAAFRYRSQTLIFRSN